LLTPEYNKEVFKNFLKNFLHIYSLWSILFSKEERMSLEPDEIERRKQIGHRISKRMYEVGISTQKQLAMETGLPLSAVNEHIRGRKGISIESLRRYAEVLETSIDYLVAGKEPTPDLKVIEEIVHRAAEAHVESRSGSRLPKEEGLIPVLTKVPAGAPNTWEDSYPAGYAAEYIPNLGWKGEHIFALTVSGESMAPVLHDGDRVVVDPDQEFIFSPRGKVGVIQKGMEDCMVKWVFKRGDYLSIESENPEFKHLDMIIEVGDPDWRFFKIVGILRETEGDERF